MNMPFTRGWCMTQSFAACQNRLLSCSCCSGHAGCSKCYLRRRVASPLGGMYVAFVPNLHCVFDRFTSLSQQVATNYVDLCKALGKSNQQRYLLPRYIKLLKDQEPEVRVASAYQLGDMFRVLDVASATQQVHHDDVSFGCTRTHTHTQSFLAYSCMTSFHDARCRYCQWCPSS